MDPLTIATTLATVATPFLSGNKSSSSPSVVNTSQNVSQTQSLSIPAQSDISSQLGLLLGSATTPVNTGGTASQIDSLYNQALGIPAVSQPATAAGLDINKILIYGSLAIAAVLIIRKIRRGS